ncbi:amino acid adenylation domain-containing protein [Nostoc sp. DedSLP04]|uniref:non-ribosomal peptide synthetase n=1 Tax=Nostoc sp. DedSLP04 TaxID=3075401 RepID=UPI002AD2074F|nr:amino acid adenylation domain-containing protein [Nostoc sp. DedSLP04]MDZ8034016.1 amino acid adenylation domain-containing protein [Nostoc sp. DedSLP04]
MQTNIIEGFQISPHQKHLWLLQQDTVTYRAQLVILIEGIIKVNLLKEALYQLVKRHKILRTNFRTSPKMKTPIQIINDISSLSLQELNLSDLEIEQQNTRIEELFVEQGQQTFDYEKDSVLRFVLATLSTQKYALFITLPTLCADAWTLQNICKEIASLYDTYQNNLEKTSEPLIQYVQFSEWQNEIIKLADAKIGIEYWRKKNIFDFYRVTLPFENQLVEQPEFKPRFLTLTIPHDVVTKIQTIAQKHETSLSVFLLNCWLVLLWRLTGQSNMIVGTADNGRICEELEGAVGLLAKYLPVHCYLEENIQFSKNLRQVDELIREVAQWQEYFTWHSTVGETENVEKPTFLPFCFDFIQQSVKYSAGNVSFEIYKQYSCIDRFKVKLSCIKKEKDIIAEFHYDSKLFSTENINYLARQFHTLLKSVLNNPEKSIGNLEILSDVERERLLVEFNNTRRDYVNDKCIQQLFESQVERTPKNVAVVFKNQQLTYRELNAKANQLAHRLQALGVEPDVLVGVCVERSCEMLVGILGILKAGGAYVPIDPSYPNQRLSYMLADSQVSIILTQERLVKNLPDVGALVLCLDTLWDVIAQESDENPKNEVKTDNLAYLIYTSGSTGQPKGVQVTHQNLVHSTTARIYYYEQPIIGFIFTSSFAFDSSVAVIFWTLCQGGFVSVLPENGQLDIQQLVKAMPTAASYTQQEISHLLCLPSLYKLILEQARSQQLLSLKTVIVAGESCSKELVKQHRELLPEVSLFNEYGPTEATVWSSVYDCQNHDLNNPVSIGRPIANTQIYLLNSHLQPVPIGVLGEIYIGGLGVAKGYLNRPELTAQKFIPNPFSDEPNARLYKTGDLGRYLADGNIEFLGRLDRQVKIRGYRIELPEIEAVLNQHPAVQEAIAITQEDIDAHHRLIAYIVPKKEQVPTVDDLRSFLKNCLPEYMLPSMFVILKALPLNPNGKVDRQALPIPDQERPNLEAVFVPPSTAIEVALAEIWSQVLNVEKVGIHDNFLKLGGDSLRSIQVLSRANDRGLSFSLQEFIQHPTIHELSQVIKTNEELRIPTIKPVSRDQYQI